jgi:hypothetical protein
VTRDEEARLRDSCNTASTAVAAQYRAPEKPLFNALLHQRLASFAGKVRRFKVVIRLFARQSPHAFLGREIATQLLTLYG